jgi:hypothetical protein
MPFNQSLVGAIPAAHDTEKKFCLAGPQLASAA